MSWSSDDAAAVLTAGGLFPVGTPFDDDTPADAILARTYRNPALGGRPVVRLVAPTMAPAEDRSLEFLGFEIADAGRPVATGHRAGLGFPAWVLVHDPKRAKQALAVVKDMERVARLAKSRPGFAVDQFAELARTLPVEHTPSFWEQAGRAFIAAGNNAQAASMFGKAREAEQVYALDVDEAARRETFLEFAFAGALTVKAIAGYVAELTQRYEPVQAYDALVALALRRTLGGLPPWTDLPKQIRKLAKAAGLDVAAEEQRILGVLLTAPATGLAAAGFWKSWRTSVIGAAKRSAEIRGRLLNLNPKPSTYDNSFGATWLTLLEEAGALEALVQPAADVEPGAGPDGGAAAWLEREVVRSYGGYRSTGLPDELFSLVERMAERLRTDGTPVWLPIRWDRELDGELLDLCLAERIPVVDPRPQAELTLEHWLNRGCRRDLAALAADERFRDVLRNAISTRSRTRVDRLAAVPALAPIVRAWLTDQIGAVGESSLIGATRAIHQLDAAIGPDVFPIFPDVHAEFARIDLAESLAATMRTGLLDELGWPALEAAVGDLGGDPDDVRYSCSFPVLTVVNGVRAIAVDADRRLIEHDLRLTNTVRWSRPTALYAGGQLVVTWNDGQEQQAYWTDDPADVFQPATAAQWRWGAGDADGYTPLLEDGGRVSGGRALHPGDRFLPETNEPVITDGETYWVREWVYGGTQLRELDPSTGQKGRKSAPAFFEDAPRAANETLLHRQSILGRLPDGLPSPFGGRDGLLGFRVIGRDDGQQRIEAYDDTALTIPRRDGFSLPFVGLLQFPGAEHPVAIVNGAAVLYDPVLATFVAAPRGSGHVAQAAFRHRSPEMLDAAGTPFGVPPAYWPCLRVRDERGSRSLRTTTREQAREVLDVAARELAASDGESAPGDLPRTAEAVAAAFPDVSDPLLLAGIVGTVRHAARQQRARDAIADRRPPTPSSDQPSERSRFDHQQLWAATRPLGVSQRGAAPDGYISDEARFLHGDPAFRPGETFGHGGLLWWQLIGSVGSVAFLAAHPFTSDRDRAVLIGLLELWATLPFVDDTTNWWHGVVTGVQSYVPVSGSNPKGRFLIASSYGASPFVEVRTAGERVVPAEYEVVECSPVPPGWGTAAQITAFLDVLRQRGPFEWDPAVPAELARRTGLTPAEAILLWAGFPNFDEYGQNFLDPELRKRFGLKVAEAKMARDALKKLNGAQRLLWASALGEDPNGLWSPLEAVTVGDLSSVERVATVWIAAYGERMQLPDDAYAALKALGRSTDASKLVSLLVAPGEAGLGEFDANHLAWHHVPSSRSVQQSIVDAAHLLPWALTTRPVGDPLRRAAPALLDEVRRALDDDGLLLQAAFGLPNTSETEIHALFGHEPFAGVPNDQDYVDDGLSVVHPVRGDVWFRPARMADDERTRLLHTLIDDGQGVVMGGWSPVTGNVPRLVRWLKSDDATGMADSVRTSMVRDGGYDANPASSVPELVGTAEAALGLDADGAALFLQLLTLLEPTDKNVKRWNEWTPTRHKKAVAALTEQGLVLPAKRERAGRGVFLPGGWVAAKAPNLPVETWKLPLYELRIGDGGRVLGTLDRQLPLRALPSLFVAAWERYLEDPPA